MDARRSKNQDLNRLKPFHLENMFVVKTDSDGGMYYDLTDTLVLDPSTMNPTVFVEHSVKKGDTFYNLSTKYYGTPHLWWLIGVTNKIDDPFSIERMIGENIKILKSNIVSGVLNLISE